MFLIKICIGIKNTYVKGGSLGLGYSVYIHASKHRTSLRAVESSSLWPGLTGPVDVLQSPTQPETFGDGNGRSIRESEPSPRIPVARTRNSFLTRSKSRVRPSRYRVIRAHTRVCNVLGLLQASAHCQRQFPLAKYYFFTFYEGRKFARFVAPLRRWKTRRIKISPLSREMREYWADPFFRKICVASDVRAFSRIIFLVFFIRERDYGYDARERRECN